MRGVVNIKLKPLLAILFSFLMLLGQRCFAEVEGAGKQQSVSQRSQDVGQVASLNVQYFDVYAQRRDFQRFMDFYADDAVVEDLVYGHRAVGKSQIASFFDWKKGDFSLVNDDLVLKVHSKTIAQNQVITRGEFSAFKYFGNVLGPWRFIIYQRYNAHGKIEYQEDWINYTPKANYTGGENLNSIGSQMELIETD